MPKKNFLQDIVRMSSPDKGSPPSSKLPNKITDNPIESLVIISPPVSIHKENMIDEPPRQHRAIWGLAIFSIISLFFALSFLFSGAKVTVVPKIETFLLDDTFSAKRNPSEGDIPFQLMALKGEETKNITGTGTKAVEQKATGRVVIYNSYSSSPQRLLINTRLESPIGKIYKTLTPTTVPGMTIKDGQQVPGSVEVTIVADASGEEYNSPMTDFTIVGFKGNPKYQKFYARSKTDITGGFKGTIGIIDDKDKSDAAIELKQTLKDKLIKQARAQIPDGFILYDEATILSPSNSEPTIGKMANDGLVPMTEEATLYAFLLPEQALTKKIAENGISQFDDSSVYIEELKNITFVLDNKETIVPEDASQISFKLSSDVHVIWNVDQDKLTNDLVGTYKKDFQKILSNYKNIDSAEVTVRPFWKRTIPDDKKKITIIIKTSKN
ncbi:MAG: hypothetical protein WC795_00445 [Candidatus Paceibacterota bacterium]|jgi:hypothetical protein